MTEEGAARPGRGQAGFLLLLGGILLAAGVHLHTEMGLLRNLGRQPALQELLYGEAAGWMPLAHGGDLWRLPVDLLLVLPGLLLVASGLARLAAVPDLRERLRGAADRRGAAALALLGALLVAGVGSGLLAWTDLSDDETTYRLQARMLARGSLTLDLPEDPGLFGRTFVLLDAAQGRYVPKYTYGWPAMLLPGELLGDVHLVLPVYAGLLVLAVMGLGATLYGRRVGAAAGALLVLSPFFLTTMATPISQVGSALLGTLVVLGVCRGSARSLALAGVAWGLAVHVRQPGAAALLAPVVAALALRRPPRRRVAWLAPGLVVGLLALGATHEAMTGDWATPASVRYLPHEVLGFDNASAERLRHTPTRALWNTLTNALRFDSWALGWPSALVALLPVALLSRRREDRVLAAWLAGQGGLYAFYYYPGIASTGPVYWFELVVPTVLLVARSLQELGRRFPGDRRLDAAVLALLVYGLVIPLPERLGQVATLASVAGAPGRALQALPEDASVVVLAYRFRAPIGWVYDYPVLHPDLVPAGRPLLVRSVGHPEPVERWRARRGGGPVLVLEGDARDPKLRPWGPPFPPAAPRIPWTPSAGGES